MEIFVGEEIGKRDDFLEVRLHSFDEVQVVSVFFLARHVGEESIDDVHLIVVKFPHQLLVVKYNLPSNVSVQKILLVRSSYGSELSILIQFFHGRYQIKSVLQAEFLPHQPE